MSEWAWQRGLDVAEMLTIAETTQAAYGRRSMVWFILESVASGVDAIRLQQLGLACAGERLAALLPGFPADMSNKAITARLNRVRTAVKAQPLTIGTA